LAQPTSDKSMEPDTFVGLDPKLTRTRIVRRYLTLPKYLDLLRSRTLYLCRADKFSDKFEGVMPATIQQAFLGSLPQADPKAWVDRTRRGNYVCCWNLSAQDNMALWQLYGGAAECVVVTSTVERLIKCAVRWDRNLQVAPVRYFDLHKGPPRTFFLGNYQDLLRCKHTAYQYENEARLIVPYEGADWKSAPPGLRLPIDDPNDLIRSVVVAPEAQPWFFDLVEDITRRYGVKSPVRHSKLAYMPK